MLHKQTKVWVTWNRKFFPWAFFVVNNGDQLDCGQEQLKCTICFPHVVPHTLIEK